MSKKESSMFIMLNSFTDLSTISLADKILLPRSLRDKCETTLSNIIMGIRLSPEQV